MYQVAVCDFRFIITDCVLASTVPISFYESLMHKGEGNSNLIYIEPARQDSMNNRENKSTALSVLSVKKL